MFYENFIPYYSPYEEEDLLRQIDTFNHQQQQQQRNSFYYYNKRKECSSSSLINSSLSNNSSSSYSSSSSNFFPTSENPSISKKVINSDVDALSFCHTIYITIKKRRNTPSCSSSPTLNYSHQTPGDSQLLLLPDICCTIPASKLSSKRCMILNILSSATLSPVNLLSYSISLYRHVPVRLHHHHHRYREKKEDEKKSLYILVHYSIICVCM